MYSAGFGVPQDDAEAVRWYRLAAEQGDASGQYTLGGRYADGRGVLKDDAEAVRWYRLAADQGSALAQFELGIMYANGEGVLKDDEEAVRWFRLAAERNLQSLKIIVRSQPNDYLKDGANLWYRVAADQGDAEAQMRLGFMYYTGDGMPPKRC